MLLLNVGKGGVAASHGGETAAAVVAAEIAAVAVGPAKVLVLRMLLLIELLLLLLVLLLLLLKCHKEVASVTSSATVAQAVQCALSGKTGTGSSCCRRRAGDGVAVAVGAVRILSKYGCSGCGYHSAPTAVRGRARACPPKKTRLLITHGGKGCGGRQASGTNVNQKEQKSRAKKKTEQEDPQEEEASKPK